VTDVTFDDEVVHHTGTVLVDFWAAWCGPCRMMGPILEQIAKEYAGKLKVAKLNVDENPMTASLYAIQSIPALLIFKDGKHLETLVGAMSKPELERRLSALVS
jgi:thioredoxin